MRVEDDRNAVIDGDDVYEFHANTETQYDVSLRGEIVAEVDFFCDPARPDVTRPTIPDAKLSCLVEAWAHHLRRCGRF